ncbi:hypothetical protein HPB47_006969 [Ixodes persulcatus]|uniref:Uncharacterized protein n=1 Tax=Ixodes persulcatus TaxID=34615 RepID=A0AC60P8X9_IXOPE|nr:hypothetical protein HPB47_006969 [Ixodes persulcatus]
MFLDTVDGNSGKRGLSDDYGGGTEVDGVWNKYQLELVSAAVGRQLIIAGDGTADSPGDSPKYGTYTMLDVKEKVLHVETVQSNETGGSYHMELEGLRRSLDIFEAHSLAVAVLVMNRHPQPSAWLEREHPDICHLFDCWHVAKGSSAEDQDLILPKWCSLVAHVANVHTHLDPRSASTELNKKWLLESSPTHVKLKENVLSKHLLRDIPSLSPSAQTIATESYHRALLHFAPKLVHFGFRSVTAKCLERNRDGHRTLIVNTTSQVMAVGLRDETTLCHQDATETDHPRLFMIRPLRAGGPRFYFQKATMDPKEVDLFLYTNSELVYVEQHLARELTSVYHHFQRQLCDVNHRLLTHLTTLAMVALEEFAWTYTQQPGVTAVLRGEVVCMVQCAPVSVTYRTTNK